MNQDTALARTIPDYTKYPREFITYKWFRPLITFLLFGLFYLLLTVCLTMAMFLVFGGEYYDILDSLSGGYDSFNVYSGPGAITTLGSIALMIPALALANKIAGRRTFRSYESSRGGWNFGIFFRSLLIALVFCALPLALSQFILYGRTGSSQFTAAGLLLCTLLGPMQCIGEEFFFRGLLMQTFGSWFRLPVLAIFLQALVFASMHPYNIIGVAEIIISGCFLGLFAWLTHGIETSSAFHICNNMALFYTTGIGIGKISSQTEIIDLLLTLVIYVVFLLVILFCKRRGMFDVRKADDAAAYNAKAEAKRAKKNAKRAERG